MCSNRVLLSVTDWLRAVMVRCGAFHVIISAPYMDSPEDQYESDRLHEVIGGPVAVKTERCNKIGVRREVSSSENLFLSLNGRAAAADTEGDGSI